MDSGLALPHSYCLNKYLVEAGRLAQDYRLAGLSCNTSERTCRRTGTYERLWMYGKLCHTRLVAKNASLAAFATWVDGKHSQLSLVFIEHMNAEFVNRRTLAGSGHTAYAHAH